MSNRISLTRVLAPTILLSVFGYSSTLLAQSIGGGVFAYPGDRQNPHGKLRLLYEAAPLAFLAEQAGGGASDGTHRILDVLPTDLHQRTPLFIGNRDEVERVEQLLAEAPD